MRTQELIDSLKWYQMPVDGGQIVSVTYAIDEYYLYCRRHDRSDNTTTIHRAECNCGEFDFQPWNGQLPEIDGDWQTVGMLTLRAWDDGSSETIECEEGDDYEALAKELWDGADYGEGDYRVTVSWRVTDADDELVASGSWDVVGTTEEPECPEADEHDWTSEFEPGLKENPGVWSVGGTAMVFTAHCRHCGMKRTERVTGPQRNPGECDTTEYSEPDNEWVAEHIEEV